MEPAMMAIDEAPWIWKPLGSSTPLRRSLPSRITHIQEPVNVTRIDTFDKKVSQVAEKLTRNGVRIISKGVLQREYPNYDSKEKDIEGSCYARKIPLPSFAISFQKESLEILMARNDFLSTGGRFEPKIPIIGSQKRPFTQTFICNFCGLDFQCEESLKSHHGDHGIIYWKSPYPWITDTNEMSSEYFTDEGCVLIDLT